MTNMTPMKSCRLTSFPEARAHMRKLIYRANRRYGGYLWDTYMSPDNLFFVWPTSTQSAAKASRVYGLQQNLV